MALSQDALKRRVGDRNAFDLAREEIGAESEQKRIARQDALKRRLAAQGIGDSGIQEAGVRQVGTEERIAEAQRKRGIDIEELLQRERQSEAEANRQLAMRGQDITKEHGMAGIETTQRGQDISKELALKGLDLQQSAQELAMRGQDITKELGMAGIETTQRGQDISKELGLGSLDIQQQGLNQSRELALKGLDLQQSTQELTKLGMDQQDARFYAGLAQSDKLAQQGFNLETSRLELTKQGMNNQESQFYASLAQAKQLATQGMDIQRTQLALQEQGMRNEDARFYANLAFAKDQNEVNQAFQLQRDANIAKVQSDFAVLQDSLAQGRMIMQDIINNANADRDQDRAIQLTFLSEYIASLNPDDPQFINKLKQIAINYGNPETLKLFPTEPVVKPITNENYIPEWDPELGGSR